MAAWSWSRVAPSFISIFHFSVSYMPYCAAPHATTGSAPALYYGNIQAAFPRYDLDLVARQVLSAEKAKATLGPEESLKGTPLGESLAGTKGNALFWGVLVAVVAVLLFVLSRLLPKPPEPTK